MGTILRLIAGFGSLVLALEAGAALFPTVGVVGALITIAAVFFGLLGILIWLTEKLEIRLQRPPSLIDASIRTIYGEQPPTKSADLDRAVMIAHEDLLQERVSLADVQQHAVALLNGPMPYSTYDLATSIALAFLKDPQHIALLRECQSLARARVAKWAKAGRVNAVLAEAFETVICKRYEPRAEPTAEEAAVEKQPRSPDEQWPTAVRAYTDEVAVKLSHEFGSRDGERLLADAGMQRVIGAYETDGTPAHKAADYIIAKLKWGPKNDEEVAVQRQLVDEFAKYSLDFMTLDPEVHCSILQEALVFKGIPRTVEMFFEIADQVGCAEDSDLQRSERLADVYRTRLDILRGTGRGMGVSAIPASCRRFC